MIGKIHNVLAVNLHLSDLSALVVTSQNCDSILEANFQCDEKRDSLDTVVASIDVITHEQVVCIGWLTANLEQLTQIVELTVNITANGHWCFHLLHVGLINQYFFCLNAIRSVNHSVSKYSKMIWSGTQTKITRVRVLHSSHHFVSFALWQVVKAKYFREQETPSPSIAHKITDLTYLVAEDFNLTLRKRFTGEKHINLPVKVGYLLKVNLTCHFFSLSLSYNLF